MQELIKVEEREDGKQAVSARELYSFLFPNDAMLKGFTTWGSRFIENNELAIQLVENETHQQNSDIYDYQIVRVKNGNNQMIRDYVLSIDFTKKLCMLSKSEKGEQVRDYFIEIEKQYKSKLPTTYLEALKALVASEEEKEKALLENKVVHQRIDILTHVNKTYTATEIAKELNLKSANELNKMLADMKIQYNLNGTWVLYSQYSNLGYEEIKQEVLDNGHVIYHRRITQTGREFIINAVTSQKVVII